jgi:serine/threonine protein kinase
MRMTSSAGSQAAKEVASLLRHGAATQASFDVPAVELAAPTGASVPAPLALGTRFGDFEVVEPIGAGGMGEVFLARDVRLKREVALKILPGRHRFDEERLARYEDRGTIHYPESTF